MVGLADAVGQARLRQNGTLLVRALLDPRRMNLVQKEVSEYKGIAIPFYERWTHHHEFLTRVQL